MLQRHWKLWAAYALLVAGALLMLLPLAWMLSAAFKPLPEVMRVPPTWWPEHPTLENFRTVFTRFPLGRYLINTAVMSGIVVASVLVTSAMAGYALARFRFRAREALFLMFLASLMIPFQVRMIPLYQMLIHFRQVNTFPGLVFPFLVDAFGIFLMRQFFLTVPLDLI